MRMMLTKGIDKKRTQQDSNLRSLDLSRPLLRALTTRLLSTDERCF